MLPFSFGVHVIEEPDHLSLLSIFFAHLFSFGFPPVGFPGSIVFQVPPHLHHLVFGIGITV